MNQTITVTEVVEGKFGEQVKDGKAYFSYGKFFKGPKLKVGDVVTVELYQTAKGNNYINKVVDGATANVVEAPKAKKAAVAKSVDNSMSKADWAQKDRNQLIGGRSHDAVSLVNTALVTGTELSKVLEMYKEALDGVLKLADQVK